MPQGDAVNYKSVAVEVLLPVLLAVLAYASARAAQFITTKVQSERSRTFLLQLNEAVYTAVTEVQQTTVKDAVRAGEFTPELQAEVKAIAMAKARALLGPDARKVTTAQLSAHVETAVHEMKRGK